LAKAYRQPLVAFRDLRRIPVYSPKTIHHLTRNVPPMLNSPQQKEILRQEIARLLQKRAIEPVLDRSAGYHSSIFVIPKCNGSFRSVFNLKRLNAYMRAFDLRICHDYW